jgi:hypothetical protein
MILDDNCSPTTTRRALAVLDEARIVATTVRNHFVSGIALSAEVVLHDRHGPPDEALARFHDAIEHWRATGNEMLLITTLRNLVVLYARTAPDEAAARLAATLGTPRAEPLLRNRGSTDRDRPSPLSGSGSETLRTWKPAGPDPRWKPLSTRRCARWPAREAVC